MTPCKRNAEKKTKNNVAFTRSLLHKIKKQKNKNKKKKTKRNRKWFGYEYSQKTPSFHILVLLQLQI